MARGVDPVEDLKAAVDWFVEAVGSRSPRPIKRVADPVAAARDLAELERRIVPFELPPELRWFWGTWDPDGFGILPWENLDGPDSALFSWNLIAWDGDSPRALLPVGCASHTYLLVDLTDPRGAPASLWSSDFDEGLVREAPSLAALIRASAELVEGALVAGRDLARADADPYGYFRDLYDGDGLRAILDRHFASSATERRHASVHDPRSWREAWHDAQRSMTGGSQPRGRTHTVVELIAVLGTDDPDVRARLRGRLTTLGGGLEGGPDDLMRLEDETGGIDLAVPASKRAPGWVGGGELEVEVVGRGPLPPRPERRRPDARKVREVTARHGSWIGYLLSDQGRTDPELEANLLEHLRALGDYKRAIPRVERTDLIS